MRKSAWVCVVAFLALCFSLPVKAEEALPVVESEMSEVTTSEASSISTAETAPVPAKQSRFGKFVASKVADLVDLAAPPVSSAKTFAETVKAIRAERAEAKQAKQAAMYQYVAERRQALSEGSSTAMSKEQARASIERIRVQVDSRESLSPEKEAELEAAIERILSEIEEKQVNESNLVK